MKRIFPPRKRPRAIAQPREKETPAIDPVALAIAIWLSAMVGLQLIQRMPAPQQAAAYAASPQTAATAF